MIINQICSKILTQIKVTFKKQNYLIINESQLGKYVFVVYNFMIDT